jgi:DNA-binding transcriptional MerR regulator
VKTLDLLRKKDLHTSVGSPKSTVADWIEDFNVYIPKVKQGNVTYYKPETIDVLKFIKKCRDQNYHKAQIMQMLADKGFPITVEEAVEDVKKSLEGDSPRDTLLTVMQTMGQAVSKIAEQDETLKTLSEQQNGQDERLNELEKRTEEMDHFRREFEEMKKQVAATNEKLEQAEKELAAAKEKKGFFARLFG